MVLVWKIEIRKVLVDGFWMPSSQRIQIENRTLIAELRIMIVAPVVIDAIIQIMVMKALLADLPSIEG